MFVHRCRHSQERLQQDVPQELAPASVGCRPTLWLTCDDPVMERVLPGLHDTAHSIIVRHSPVASAEGLPTCDACGSGLEFVERLVEVRRVSEIVICGHARCSAVSHGHEPAARTSSPVSYQDLVRRASDRSALLHNARKHLLRRLQLVEELAGVAAAIRRHELQVHALFYLEDTGVLSRFDRPTGEFVLLSGQG